MSVKEFQMYAVNISDDLKDIDGRSHQDYIVPPQVNPLHFINDPWLFKGCMTPWIVQDLIRKQTTLELYKSYFWRVLQT